MAYIANLIQCVDATWNRQLKTSKAYYESYKDLDRKTFASKAKEDLTSKEFSIAMLYYKRKSTDVDLSLLQASYIKDKEWQTHESYNGGLHHS